MHDLCVVQLYLEMKYKTSVEHSFVYNSEDAGEIFKKEIGRRNVECVAVICLDSTYRLINYANIATGAIDSVNSNTAELFKIALLSNASKIFIAHNHPSGILQATSQDVLMTKNVGSVAKLFNMELIDSLIVGNDKQIVSIRKQNEESELH